MVRNKNDWWPTGYFYSHMGGMATWRPTSRYRRKVVYHYQINMTRESIK
jgi:hypothetical protein